MNNNTTHIQTGPVVTGGFPILEVHTPTTSFAIQHSLAQETLQALFNKLSRKANTGANGARVGPGWLKYEWNDGVWNLDDDSDYAIFVWRQQTPASPSSSAGSPPPPPAPTLHLQNPSAALPDPPAYRNVAFYLFRPNNALSTASIRPKSRAKSIKSARSKRSGHADAEMDDGIPKHKKEFNKFHSENGVRTVTGKVGPVENVRMLLKNGYRHVYMSRNFAMSHGFIPRDAAPGHYGYGGLVNIGQWPLTLGRTTTNHAVFLSEETHFDVVLGRAFMERRGIKTDPLDLTSVICLDTGEKLECEVVVIRDGKGEIVTVT